MDQAKLKELLHYNPATGEFTWLVDKGQRARKGVAINGIRVGGYMVIRIDNKNYRAHRLAWLYQTGEFPKEEVDHINGVKSDNCWDNLRDVSRSHNQQNQKISLNNTSGFKGVSFIKATGKWRAYIRVKSKVINLGCCFSTPIEAALARCNFENKSPDWIADSIQSNHIRLRELGYKI